ncbi:hypothetical protein [Rhizobium binxianense]
MELSSAQIDHADRLFICRQRIEEAVHQLIFSEKWGEFSSAEIAMAIADVADDYILKVVMQRSATH